MRHNSSGRRLGRSVSHRKALFANLAASLIKHEQIVTTLPKAGRFGNVSVAQLTGPPQLAVLIGRQISTDSPSHTRAATSGASTLHTVTVTTAVSVHEGVWLFPIR